MFQTSEEAILFHNLEGKILVANRAALNLLGDIAETAERIDELIVESDVSRYWSQVYAAKEKEGAASVPMRMRSNKQVSFDAVAHITRVPGANVEFWVTLRDISRQKEAESRASELYATISHEMRTPLTSIYGALSTLDENADALDSHMGREMISIARRSTERILRLVNEILDFRKMESGGYTLNLEAISAEELLEDALASMRSFADSRQVRLVGVTGGSHLGKVFADRDRVLQTLCNLISNAIKHSHAEQEVQVRAHKRSTGMIRFAVSDSGAGIEADEIPKLFEKYYQAERLDGGKVEGTGLGLAICKSLVEAHGGTIGCDSRPSSGSTFWFELRSVPEKEIRPDATVTRPAISTAAIYSQNQSVLSRLSQVMSVAMVPQVVLERPGEIVNVVAEKGCRILALDLCSDEPLGIVEQVRTVSYLTSPPRIILFSSKSEAVLLPILVRILSDDENDEKRNQRIRSFVGELSADIEVVLIGNDRQVREAVYPTGRSFYDNELKESLTDKNQKVRLVTFLKIPDLFEHNTFPTGLSELFSKNHVVELVLIADRSHGDLFSRQFLNLLEVLKQNTVVTDPLFEQFLELVLDYCTVDSSAGAH